MRIAIVSEAYPGKGDPSFTFVQQLAYALSNEGHEIICIAPQSITKAIIRKLPIRKYKTVDVSPDGHKIQVIRPYFISFSNTKIRLLQKLTKNLMKRAVTQGIKSAGKVDAFYCYFWHIGFLTASIVDDTPIFVQASECEITVSSDLIKKEYIEKIRGVVCASRKNMEESVAAGLTDEAKCQIVVNGYRPDQFYRKDKAEQREKLGLPANAFIVGFVGGFIPRKGIEELSKAINRFPDVYSIFIGRGPNPPQCERVLYEGSLEHEKIVEYLNCADIFVLPTRAEGCCNAIIEALACGLPVVSSNKSFNNEILDENCSIRVDETNVEEIYDAIYRLKNNVVLQDEMSRGALSKAKALTIERRGHLISKFIREMISNGQ